MSPSSILVGRRPEEEEDSLAPRPTGELRVLDVGTGSGCLAVTLARELPNASAIGIDLSSAALAWARQNADEHSADVEFFEGDALRILRDRVTRIDTSRQFELIVSNPPYIAQEDADSLDEEVRTFEPGEALFAPKGDPDYWVRELCGLAPKLLVPGGLCLIELGHDQSGRLSELLTSSVYRARLHQDLAGIDRVLELAV